MKIGFDTITNQIKLQDLTNKSPETQKAVKDVIKALTKHQLSYLEAKEVLDYSNQVLLNELLNKKKL